MILICALALIVVGPDKLPDLARSIAKGVQELKKTVSGLKESLTEELEPSLKTVRPELEEASKALKENLEQQSRTSQALPEVNAGQPSDGAATEKENNSEVNNEDASKPAAVPSMTTEELIARAQQVKNNDLGEDKTHES